MPDSRPRRGRSTARLVTTAAVVVVVLAIGGVTAYAATRDDGPSYRTAVVTTQTVQQSLQAVGTVAPATASTVSFPVSGIVTSVLVVVGQRVTAGQRLATLDTTSLQYAVAQGKAAVASAELTLYQAENGQASTGSSGSSGSRSSTSASSTSGSSTSGSSKALTAAQQRVVGAQRQLDAALSRTTKDLALATSLCAASATASPSPSPSSTVSGAAHPSGPPSAPGGPAPTTCAQAQALVLSDEQAVSGQEQALAKQVQALDKLIASSGSSASRSGSGSNQSSGSSTTTVSAAQLAADQANVDAAVAALAVAQQNLAQATIVSPTAGIVSMVGLTVGSRATAGSSTSAISVIGSTHVVTIAVDVTRIPQVAVGQQATVVPDGSATPLAATVTRVGVAPTTSGGTAYAVTLGLNGAVGTLRDGTQATVTLQTKTADHAVAVPSSAVHHLGTFTTVTVLDGSTTQTVRVTVGAVGPVYTQITQGLTAGQLVVLADLDEAVPASNTTPNRFGAGGGLGAGAGLGGFTGTGPVRIR